MPTLNVSPGELVVVNMTTESELSVAVGSVHVIATLVEPDGIATLMSSGHPVMTGSMLSEMAIVMSMTWQMKWRGRSQMLTIQQTVTKQEMITK